MQEAHQVPFAGLLLGMQESWLPSSAIRSSALPYHLFNLHSDVILDQKSAAEAGEREYFGSPMNVASWSGF
jgi:hypothetical protein